MCSICAVASCYGVTESSWDEATSAKDIISRDISIRKLFYCGESSRSDVAAYALMFTFLAENILYSYRFFSASLRQRIEPITAVPAFLSRRRALKRLILLITSGISSRGVPSPLIQGCAMMPSALRRADGSTTSKLRTKSFASSDMSSQ